MKKMAIFLLLSLPTMAQTIKVTTPTEPDTVTLTLAYEATDPKFTAKECLWYIPSGENLPALLIHTGCGSFTREYSKGVHRLFLLVNGRGKFGDGLDQRSDVIQLSVKSRFEIVHAGR